MSALVISTVGTSALEEKKLSNSLPPGLLNWAKSEAPMPNERWEKELADLYVRRAAGHVWPSTPAEISSLSLIVKRFKIQAGDGSRFVFLCSDTDKGRASVRVVSAAFRRAFAKYLCKCKEGCPHIHYEELAGIQSKDPEKFEKGVAAIGAVLARERGSFLARYPGGELLYNFTGGYKGLVPSATDFCNLHKFRLVYQYEEFSALVTKKPELGSPSRLEEVPAL